MRPYFLGSGGRLHGTTRLLRDRCLFRVLSWVLLALQWNTFLDIYFHRLWLWLFLRRGYCQVLNCRRQLHRLLFAVYLTWRQLRGRYPVASHLLKGRRLLRLTRLHGVLLGRRHWNTFYGVRLMLFELFVSVHSMKRELFDNCKNVTLVLFYWEKELIEAANLAARN